MRDPWPSPQRAHFSSFAVFLLSITSLTSSSPLCKQGLQFWDPSQQNCTDCTTCPAGQVVLRPCQPYKNTHCGPLSALGIDWSWVRPQKQQVNHNSGSSIGAPRVLIVKPLQSLSKTRLSSGRPSVTTSSSSTTTSATVPVIKLETSEASVVTSTPPTSPPTSSPPPPPPFPQQQEEEVVKIVVTPLPPRPPPPPPFPPTRLSATAEPFSAAETLVWDWQAVTLVLTVTLCGVFLAFLAGYSIYHARKSSVERRRLQRDLDEASAHLSLFTGVEQGSSSPTNTAVSPREQRLYPASSQCLYLEKLLARKQQEAVGSVARGNIYVETGRQATPAPARRSTRWKAKRGGLR